MEAVVLAGGLGTRLRQRVPDLPKPMAPVNGEPFLAHVLRYLERHGVSRVVLSVGYLGDLIARHFGERFEGLVIDYCFEEQPLGTGGAICAAIAGTSASTVLVMNGDTFVEFDPARLVSLREKHHAHVAIGSVLVDDASRYGHIRIGANARVIGIDEKTHQGPGPINAGVYAVDPAWIRAAGSVLAPPHSFEKGLLTDAIQAGKVVADTVSGRFIDIGIPEDFERAGKLLAQS